VSVAGVDSFSENVLTATLCGHELFWGVVTRPVSAGLQTGFYNLNGNRIEITAWTTPRCSWTARAGWITGRVWAMRYCFMNVTTLGRLAENRKGVYRLRGRSEGDVKTGLGLGHG